MSAISLCIPIFHITYDILDTVARITVTLITAYTFSIGERMNSPNISCKVLRLTLIDINDIHIRIKNTDGIDRRSPPNFNVYKFEENNKEKLEKYSNFSLFSHLLGVK